MSEPNLTSEQVDGVAVEDRLEALAYFQAAVTLSRTGGTFVATADRLAALDLARTRCERARRRAERVLPHLIGTWVEVPR